jgi:peptidoglycan/xylan/chitin deacetylase (PgdA/CDA1 family)
MSARRVLKQVLATAGGRRPARGASLLIYHRVEGGTGDELDLPVIQLEAQLDHLVSAGHQVVPLDIALDRLEAGDDTPSVVLTFDDGFADVYDHAWPLLRDRSLPFTLYVPAGLMGGTLRWEGSRAASQGARAMSWDQLTELHGSGLCTVGNHTFDHAEPDRLDEGQLDRCSDLVEDRLGLRPAHFAYTWGIEVPAIRSALARRFRSAATGVLGRNRPGCDLLALRRIPVRRSDPHAFFAAKLRDPLSSERAYELSVRAAKRLRAPARRVAEPDWP